MNTNAPLSDHGGFDHYDDEPLRNIDVKEVDN